MDVSDLTLAGWPVVARLGDAPEALTAALVSAVATLGLILFFAPRLPIAGSGRAARRAARGRACDFLINGASVKPLTEPARALLDSLSAGGPRLAALTVHLAADCPDLQPDLEALVLYGTGFRHHCPRGDGTAFEIVGEPRGGAAFLSVRPASEEARALRETQTELARAVGEMRFLRDVLDRAPVLAWSQGRDGQVDWANAPYRDRFDPPAGDLPDHRIADAFGHVLEEVPLTARGGETRRRVAVPGPRRRRAALVRAQRDRRRGRRDLRLRARRRRPRRRGGLAAALRRDADRDLRPPADRPRGLRQEPPARPVQPGADPAREDRRRLAGRPAVACATSSSGCARPGRCPSRRTSPPGAASSAELEEGARDGTYEENWQLPSGKIFRVTGRPHPQGALAFLFEDISTAIMLERRYRSELELSQATLDRMSEAVAVFDASGMLVFVNSAFEALWGLDPMERLDGPGVAAMAAFWAERCAPSGAWARLTEFTTAAEARTSWTEAVATRDGRAVEMLVAPLPDASALVVFRDRAPPADAGAAARSARGARRRGAARAGRGAAAEARRGAAGGADARGAPDARRRPAGPAAGAGAGAGADRPAEADAADRADGLEPLAGALAAPRPSRRRAGRRRAWTPALRRTAIALGLAAAEVAAPTARITLALRRRRRRRRPLTVARTAPGDAPRASASRSPGASSRPTAAAPRSSTAGGLVTSPPSCPTAAAPRSGAPRLRPGLRPPAGAVERAATTPAGSDPTCPRP